eukprot:SM000061S19217  [mRNA]  locus=s61:114817:115948:- [translate_table: standard]
MTDSLGQVARQVAGWLAGQVARPEAGRARPDIPLARIHPFKGGSLACHKAGHGATRSHPWRGGVARGSTKSLGAEARRQFNPHCRCSPPQPPPHSAAGPAAQACAQEVESPPVGGATGPVFVSFGCADALTLVREAAQRKRRHGIAHIQCAAKPFSGGRAVGCYGSGCCGASCCGSGCCGASP